MAMNQGRPSSTEHLRIIVEKNPSESRLSELGIKSWPKWGCSPGKYQLKFEAEETCYLVKGKVRVYPLKFKLKFKLKLKLSNGVCGIWSWGSSDYPQRPQLHLGHFSCS